VSRPEPPKAVPPKPPVELMRAIGSPRQPIRVSVTAADITAGTRGRARSCPVCLAMNRATGKKGVAGRLLLWPDDRAGHVATPPAVAAWMEDFDEGRPVRPFTFEIATPYPKGDRC
jgi:hypothetical protein